LGGTDRTTGQAGLGGRDGGTEEAQDGLEGAHAQGTLEGGGPDLFRMPTVPPSEAAAPRLRELRLLRRPPGSRDGVTTTAIQVLGAPDGGGQLYELALTHRSFAFEQASPAPHNERLEFLGDAILETVVTDLIYTTYPDLSEGEMARLRASVVNTHALADIARSIGLGDEMKLGRGEEASGGRDKASLLANSFEAVIGAVYLDRGLDAVQEALDPIFALRLQASLDSGSRYDAKTALQEVVVKEIGGAPRYRVASSGPDHDKSFTADVFVNDDLMGTGSGHSKKEAELNAAREALVRLETDDTSKPDGDEDRDARVS
jgi:ribonuclease-3